MTNNNLELDDNSIIEEIKEIYGDKFDQLTKNELENLIFLIRDKRYYEYETIVNQINEEYRKKSKLAFIFGTLFISLCIVMIAFNILYYCDAITLSITAYATIDCILGISVIVFLIYYITFFKRFKKYVYQNFKKI